MTTFFTEKMAFLHVPKTGGSWVTAAVGAAGVHQFPPLARDSRDPSPGYHACLTEIDTGGRFTVGFVRHPLDWWRSYWAYRMRVGWDAREAIDAYAGGTDFNQFIALVLERFPGHLDGVLDDYLGAPGARQLDFIGRFEQLEQETATALRLSGERFSHAALAAQPQENVNDYERFEALYEPQLAARMVEAEQRTIARFYADRPLPPELLAPVRRRLRGGSATCGPAPLSPIGASEPQLEERLGRLEGALERALENERRLEEVLHDTTVALEELRSSRILSLSRPLRLGFYRLRSAARRRDGAGGAERLGAPAERIGRGSALNRRTAITVQIAATTPSGHAPERNP